MARKLILAILIIAGLMMNINKEIKMAEIQYVGETTKPKSGDGGGIPTPVISPNTKWNAPQTPVRPRVILDPSQPVFYAGGKTALVTPIPQQTGGAKISTTPSVGLPIGPSLWRTLYTNPIFGGAFALSNTPNNPSSTRKWFTQKQLSYLQDLLDLQWGNMGGGNRNLGIAYTGPTVKTNRYNTVLDPDYWAGKYYERTMTLADQANNNDSTYWGGYGSKGGGGSGYSYNPWNWFFSLLNWRI